ncbi:phosphoenolpyruvate synthase [Babesia caballi]|uniref:Phosphoenolpyruvate synthase n=1 Tax=Babesia caballi TaxID=5871 RepID=A0AAV4LSE3_BABCB|nr:phosphoenolpyruvate synthase [Babesia caballi]
MVTVTRSLTEALSLETHRDMAHGIGGAGSKVVGCAWLAAAKTMKVVGEEGLEGGRFALTAAVGGTGAFVLTFPPGVAFTIGMAKMGGRSNIRALRRLYLFPKPTMPPAATFIKISERLLRQEGQLKLQSVGVLRKLSQKRGTGRVRKCHAVTEKEMKPGDVVEGGDGLVGEVGGRRVSDSLKVARELIEKRMGDHYVSEAGAVWIMKPVFSPRPAVMAQPVELGEAVDGLDGGVGAGVEGILNLADVVAKTTSTSIIGIITVEVLHQRLELLLHSISPGGIPTAATITLEHPLEVVANFSGHGVGIDSQATTEIRLKSIFQIYNKLINLAPTASKLALNFPGYPLQPIRPVAIFFVKLSNYTVQFSLVRLLYLFLTTLQHRYRKGYSRVAQPMCRNVGWRDSGAGDLASGITTATKGLTFIPNELLKPLGQFGNEAMTTTRTVQSLLNILKILVTKPGIRQLNIRKKLLNLLGEGSDGCTIPTTTPPILPRHPQDPVDGLLQVRGGVTRERPPRTDKGLYKGDMRTL